MATSVDNKAARPQQESAPFMSSHETLSEDSLKYIKDNRISQLMEYMLRSILREKPGDPVKHIHEMTTQPFPPQIVLLGPPASGKGTQALEICNYYKDTTGRKPVHVSSGDLLREEVSKGTHLGKIAEDYMAKGDLVPDSLITGMVRNRLSQDDAVLNGWLLDGFPRTRAQAEDLDTAGFCPRLVIALETPEHILIERVEGRRTDPVTGHIYHLKYNPPPAKDKALIERLQHREDDSRDVLVPRLKRYHEMLDGLLGFYEPLIVHIDANRPPDDITEDIANHLSKISTA
ncbi:putative Adenylate kinase [Leptomonas seymouri]|uniref:Putative Adenylate kinase n=1 Tax=Leptomonas seymouri TaxID=5684 RepID=A0A0N0P5M7_LEPSE|nr:putative Adenylate kinase [Leptomonas seymouri]|eukprot:KPI86167.1 putative Adenylate kinase [Leptomonas seymouri]